VLAHASLVVGNDSGVTHLAAVAGAPVVALFGPTDPALWRPLGDALVLRRCDRRATEEAPIRVCDDPACVQAITVEEVLRAAGTLDVENCVERGRNAR
jgi:ADP-heptose:LPS heptosyltransferase